MKKLLLFCLPWFSLAADIGTVTAIRGDVNITRGVALYQAHLGLEIEEKDTFFTSAQGSMQITFKDNTVVTLGKNTVFSVSEYLYEEGAYKAKAKFKFQKGVFKSITGRIGKISPKQFQIESKNSTIGVRGTEITGRSTQEKEEIICTFGEISVTTGETERIAKANEKVEIKLDPRIDYKVASAVDIMVQEQVVLGIKQANDPQVIHRPKTAIEKSYKPEVVKALIAQGIDPKDAPVVSEAVITPAAPIETQELENLEQEFSKTPDFKPQEELREEIKIKEELIQPEPIQQTPKPQPYTFEPIAPEKIAAPKPHLSKEQTQGVTRSMQQNTTELHRELINNHLSRTIQNTMQGF